LSTALSALQWLEVCTKNKSHNQHTDKRTIWYASWDIFTEFTKWCRKKRLNTSTSPTGLQSTLCRIVTTKTTKAKNNRGTEQSIFLNINEHYMDHNRLCERVVISRRESNVKTSIVVITRNCWGTQTVGYSWGC
jgi:hypothetical protein